MKASDPYVLWDAAYVLGSLPAVERREFEGHLSSCQLCQQQVAEISGISGLLALARVENDETSPAAADVSGPLPLYAGLAAKVAVRRRRFMVAAAAAAVVLAGTTAAITTAVGPGTAPPPSAISSASPGVPLTFAGTSPRGLVASGSLASFAWGTQISWHCSYAAGYSYGGEAAGEQAYVLVMVSTAGVETTVASWTAGPGSEVSPTATTGSPVHEIARLDIRDSTGATLLSAAP